MLLPLKKLINVLLRSIPLIQRFQNETTSQVQSHTLACWTSDYLVAPPRHRPGPTDTLCHLLHEGAKPADEPIRLTSGSTWRLPPMVTSMTCPWPHSSFFSCLCCKHPPRRPHCIPGCGYLYLYLDLDPSIHQLPDTLICLSQMHLKPNACKNELTISDLPPKSKSFSGVPYSVDDPTLQIKGTSYTS